jgi:hypothetical protein
MHIYCRLMTRQNYQTTVGKRSLTPPPPLEEGERRPWWVLASESLHESFIKLYCLIKWEQELMRVDKREFTWFSQILLLDQTRARVTWQLTSESLHEGFLNFHCLIKREQELHMSWQARVYMRVCQLSLLDQTASESSIHLWKLSMLADSDRIHSKTRTALKIVWLTLNFTMFRAKALRLELLWPGSLTRN